MDIKNIIAKYSMRINSLPYVEGGRCRIFLRVGKKCIATEKDWDFTDIENVNISDITDKACVEKDVLMSLKEDKAMILCRTSYAGICISSGRKIPPILDDLVQIIGPEVKVVPPTYQKLTWALKKSSGVLVRDSGNDGGYVLTTGRNLYEAFTALTILEKAAEVNLKADCIGGAKAIGKLDCILMRRKYRKSYSRSEKEHRDVTER